MAGALSAAAGVALVLYELVQSFAVGSLIMSLVGIAGADYLVVCSQLFLIVVAMVLLGGRVPGSSRAGASRTRSSFLPTRGIAGALLLLVVAVGSFYTWAVHRPGSPPSLVVQHDKLLLERYFNGADRST